MGCPTRQHWRRVLRPRRGALQWQTLTCAEYVEFLRRCLQATFLQGVLAARAPTTPVDVPRTAAGAQASSSGGAAVGPDWVAQLQQLSAPAVAAGGRMRLVMNCELAALDESPGEWPLLATLTSGEAFNTDVVIAATGVEPAVDWCVVITAGLHM